MSLRTYVLPIVDLAELLQKRSWCSIAIVSNGTTESMRELVEWTRPLDRHVLVAIGGSGHFQEELLRQINRPLVWMDNSKKVID